jgi:hypothetical protein
LRLGSCLLVLVLVLVPRVLGRHPAVTAFRELVHHKCGKRGKGRQWARAEAEAGVEDGEAMDVVVCVAVAWLSEGMQAQAVGVMGSSVGFLGLGKVSRRSSWRARGTQATGGWGLVVMVWRASWWRQNDRGVKRWATR